MKLCSLYFCPLYIFDLELKVLRTNNFPLTAVVAAAVVILTFHCWNMMGRLKEMVAERTKIVSKTASMMRISRKVAFMSRLLSCRMLMDTMLPTKPKVATTGMRQPSTIQETIVVISVIS